MRVGVIVFPGSCDETDALDALNRVDGLEAGFLWHGERDLRGADAIVIPGGFSYGDYLRPGAIARFSPVMEAISRFAGDGGPVLGICNGFQVLAEAGLVPGALLRNASLRFAGREVAIAPERLDTRFTTALGSRGALRMPVAHGEGCYFADEITLDALERDGQVLFRYVNADGNAAAPGDPANPNGSLRAIAGVLNKAGNVAGLMPHPERAAEAILGSDDGMGIVRSLVDSAARAGAASRGAPVEVGAR